MPSCRAQGDTVIKDIVVNLGVSERQGHAAEDYAISVAGSLGAHITGIAFIYDTNVQLVYPLTSYGETPAEVLDALKRQKVGLAKAAVDRFTKATSLAGVAAESLTVATTFSGSVDRFGRIARRFDLAMIGQVEPGTNAYESNIAEGALFDSGRPMIIVPYIQKAPLKLERVMVCWDGGRPAARAVADAMPLLEKAGHVEIATIGNERGKEDAIEGADFGRHLARHGLTVEVKRIARGHMDVADALLAHAAESGTDFMVMGGHGHSRVREFFLGDVTDAVLRSLKVPVLMSH
jgi:nucleotide-binding universal stress UspA family protein